MHFTVIVPVFNRPGEVDELLASLAAQTTKPFDVLVVEDGSTVPCREVVERYADRLDVRYHAQENSGPGPARNRGAALADGDYVLFLDSDCLLPPHFFAALTETLQQRPLDAFGGPDRAHPSFTAFQRAVSYAMTSFLTTGGIRGGQKAMDTFYPKSYNMGVRREAWDATDGFPPIHPGEDIDLSLQLERQGFRLGYVEDAYVYHKRRTDLRRFFRQVFKFGAARVTLAVRQPGSLQAVHLLPSLFTGYAAGSLVLLAMGRTAPFALLAVPASLFFGEALWRERSLPVATLSVVAAFTQLLGYGSGFLSGFWNQLVRGEASRLVTGEKLYR